MIDRNGLSGVGATHAIELAIAELWAGDPGSAELRLREARDILTPLGFIWWMDSLEGSLCAAVAAQDRPREFLRLADAFDATVVFIDRDISIRRQLVRARASLIRRNPRLTPRSRPGKDSSSRRTATSCSTKPTRSSRSRMCSTRAIWGRMHARRGARPSRSFEPRGTSRPSLDSRAEPRPRRAPRGHATR